VKNIFAIVMVVSGAHLLRWSRSRLSRQTLRMRVLLPLAAFPQIQKSLPFPWSHLQKEALVESKSGSELFMPEW
jgi:hypothetical protein